MKYLKIKSIENKIYIINIDKVTSFIFNNEFINICLYENDFFHFTKEKEQYGIQIENFEKIKNFIENLAEEL